MLIRGNAVLFFTIFRLRKPVARMTAEEQKLEGEFRYVNSRIITNRWDLVMKKVWFSLFILENT